MYSPCVMACVHVQNVSGNTSVPRYCAAGKASLDVHNVAGNTSVPRNCAAGNALVLSGFRCSTGNSEIDYYKRKSEIDKLQVFMICESFRIYA